VHEPGRGFSGRLEASDAGGERTRMYLQRVGENLPQPMLAVVLSTTDEAPAQHHSERRFPSP